ncbi:hypothetical protein DFH05DRAFT_1403344 [Lentinula detonsa]|uniref:Uncharacterized protein n=1 Tax=Lentinula detonsa TaxID=2804962 RepID=A0A9W8TVQ6_9AGAR|nr:hypothetical protein DFH05DRAFT_1403344 [Lentinula detonsa]KAJ3979672.1 hypothetical protein F5890DRAFT_1420987 [Lentinula detonsa]
MSNLFNKIKSKATSGGDNGQEEQSFSIQPHPAKTNNPADLQNPAPGTGMGLNNSEQMAPFHARDPHVPTDPQVLEAVGKQEGRDELRARQAELNRDK